MLDFDFNAQSDGYHGHADMMAAHRDFILSALAASQFEPASAASSITNLPHHEAAVKPHPNDGEGSAEVTVVGTRPSDGGDYGSGGGGNTDSGAGNQTAPGTANDNGQQTGKASSSSYTRSLTGCEQAIVNNPTVQDAIQSAFNASGTGQASFAARSEQGFTVYENYATGALMLVWGQGINTPGDPNFDFFQQGAAPDSQGWTEVMEFHTHPFAASDSPSTDGTPSTDPATYLSYYAPPSNGDVYQAQVDGDFGMVMDKNGNIFVYGKSPSC